VKKETLHKCRNVFIYVSLLFRPYKNEM